MKPWYIMALILVVAGILVGCGGDTAPSTSSEEQAASVVSEKEAVQAEPIEVVLAGEGESSSGLDTSYEGALPTSSQLAIGTIQLEGTDSAVTAEQAHALLPLWQALSGDALQSDAETDAVLKQVEATMTAEQLAAIASQQLTFEDMGAWMQEQGLNFGRPQGAEGQGPFGDLSEEERADMRATRQAGGGAGFGQGGFADLTEEERASMRATAEASGMAFAGPGGPGGRGRGQISVLAEHVVELLTQRAAE
ncbi:hypothetical protein ACFLWA_12790 [Chloroflexota bacterium]